jgi:hypothetical protein
MKGIKILSLFIGVIAVGLIGYYLTDFILNGNKAAENSIANQVKQSQSNQSNSVRTNVEGTESPLTKSNSEGAVAIKTTFLPEKSNNNQLVFEVVMNTHSVDLTQYDLSKLASITFDQDSGIPGMFEWEPENTDSHHMMGNLIWNGDVGENYKNINLNLSNIDNVPARMFTWKNEGILKN